MEKTTLLSDYCNSIKDNYVLLLDKFGVCTPYDANERIYLSWEYLWLESKLETPFELFRAYVQKALSVCASTIFKPNAPTIETVNKRTRYLNVYKKYKVTHDNTSHVDITPFLDFMVRLLPIKDERDVVTKWIAHAVQYPEIRPTYHIMLTGDHGTGKGTLFSDIITPLMAGQTKSVNKFARLTGQFSSVLEDSLFLCLDDCRFGTIDTQTQLKSLLTEKSVFVEKKGLNDAGMVNTYTRIILNSNSALPLPIERSCRRWYAPTFIVHRLSREETQQNTDALTKWLLNPLHMDAIYLYLNTLDLTAFNAHRCIQTDTLKAMMEVSISTLEQDIQDFIDAGNTLFDHASLVAHLRKNRVAYTTVSLSETLNTLDYVKARILRNSFTVWMPSFYDKNTITTWPLPVTF